MKPSLIRLASTSQPSQSVTLRASGRVVVFDGYRSVYQEGRDSTSDAVETDKQDDSAILPAVDRGEKLATQGHARTAFHTTSTAIYRC